MEYTYLPTLVLLHSFIITINAYYSINNDKIKNSKIILLLMLLIAIKIRAPLLFKFLLNCWSVIVLFCGSVSLIGLILFSLNYKPSDLTNNIFFGVAFTLEIAFKLYTSNDISTILFINFIKLVWYPTYVVLVMLSAYYNMFNGHVIYFPFYV